jgi:hypothetical protein
VEGRNAWNLAVIGIQKTPCVDEAADVTDKFRKELWPNLHGQALQLVLASGRFIFSE